ncbi:MAG TPA: acetylglutamate kinase [Clostridia bacterium]|jgi:acetylglutamate kinase|nr:acetylglutamate kinase [Clostridia bacterium]
MKISNEEKAGILVEALPYIRKYYNQILVVKYGGNAMISEEHQKLVITDLVLLNQIGVKVVLVHGGGPEINDTLDKMGLKSEFVNGLRKTDKATMDVVQMVLAGKVNKDLVNLIQIAGGNAIGLCGIDGHMIEAKALNTDLGYVGEITKVNPTQITAALDAGLIPVISSIGCDKDGNVYNINADTVAARISGELKAMSLIVMTDTTGVLRDKNNLESLISEINVSEVPQLVKEGVISSGMIPKSACCVDAIRRGVKRVFIIDGRAPHAILVEILSDAGIGTMFY